MKIRTIPTAACFLIAALATGGVNAANAGDIALTVETSESGGRMLVKLLAESEAADFPGGEGVQRSMPVDGRRSLEFNFPAVAAGRYAISVFQDVNNDGDLNANLLTLPTEPYGFSNNARGTFGPAKFKDAAFAVPAEGEVRLNITVK